MAVVVLGARLKLKMTLVMLVTLLSSLFPVSLVTALSLLIRT